MSLFPSLLSINSKKQLALSILKADPGQESGKLTLPGDGGGSVRYSVLLYPCPDPRCGCGSIQFDCLPAPFEGPGSTAEMRQFWLDPKSGKIELLPDVEKDERSLRLANQVNAALTPADRECLFQWFRISKLEVIHHASVEDTPIDDLPDAQGGVMIGFTEVFPWGMALHFERAGEVWGVDEAYCVQPRCECRQTILTFLKLRDAAGKTTLRIKNAPALRYDLNSRKTTKELLPSKAGDPPLTALLATLQEACSSLNNQLGLRRLLIQRLYLRKYAGELQSHIASLVPASVKKTGRNEPCPCGSGKKYKHCCLGKKQRT